ncbi:hypothetical protein H0H81_009730 [Sphagnurus paluster]|uniref:Uncharacterized protein n=1 Tax=Sphagnurus paluster TaxID=117069 RepID=A0A9P7FKR3_9AGAR|nr:hypothetical protein H0H81_009730 [Sphagnurus paluster]
MSQYSITVEIESTTLKTLLEGGYHLVLVRDMGEVGEIAAGNIIFATFPPTGPNKLSNTQTFYWEEEYAVYATSNGFENGNRVSKGSNETELQRGQTAIIEPADTIVSGSHDASKPLTVVNEWNSRAFIVVACKGKNNEGEDTLTPHYISKVRVLGTESLLTPVQTFSCFFALSAKTATMIDYSTTRHGHFEISGANECIIGYDAQDGVPPANQWMGIANVKKLN